MFCPINRADLMTAARSKRTGSSAPAHGGDMPVISSFVETAGHIEAAHVAETFGMSIGQLAETVGLPREAVYKSARARAGKTQSRMREMLEIINRVCEWAGGRQQAMAWYRAEPIPAFGGRTAESLVKSGQAGPLRDYLDHIAMGGFA